MAGRLPSGPDEPITTTDLPFVDKTVKENIQELIELEAAADELADPKQQY